MLERQITIERTVEGRIFLSYDGQRQEVATLREALRRIEQEFTSPRRSCTQAVPNQKPAAKEAQNWIQALCGKYRNVLTPTEQYFREKQEEIELEEHKLTRRGT